MRLFIGLLFASFSLFSAAKAGDIAPTKPVLNDAASPVASLTLFRHNNRVFLPITLVTGERRMMLLDSGATTTVFFNHPETISAETEGAVPVYFPALGVEAFGLPHHAFQFSLNGAVVAAHTAVSMDTSLKADIEPDMAYDGLIGRQVFENYTVELNVRERRLTLWPRGTDLSDRFETSRPLLADAGRPVVALETELPWEYKRKPQRYMLDSGYPGSLVMWQTSKFRSRLAAIIDRPNYERTFAMIMDLGFSGTKLKRAPVFVMDRTIHAAEQDGIIGMAYLSMLHVVFDFDHGRLLVNNMGHRTFERTRAMELFKFAPRGDTAILIDLTPRLAECMRRSCLQVRTGSTFMASKAYRRLNQKRNDADGSEQ